MKEYLRINTFRTKSSEFYHVKNNKKKVSMNKAYILHSRFGLHIKEYKSGKPVKSHSGKKMKHSKSRRTKFGLVSENDMLLNIKSLAVSDSAHHDFSNTQKKRINDGTAICLFNWQEKLGITPARVLNEDQITNDYTDATTINSMHKRITFNGATEPHTFWTMPPKVTIDGNPNALPFCVQSDADIPLTEDVKKSSWWGYKKKANTVISMFTLTDPQSTGDSVATDFLRSLTGGTPNEFVTTTWESPDTLPYTYTADRVRYTIQPDTQNGMWSGVKKVFEGGTNWFKTVIVKVGKSELGIINIGTDITDQVIAAGANKLPPPGKIKNNRKYRYFGTYNNNPQNYIVTGLVCEATILSARDIGHIIQNINAATFIANGSIPKYDIITRLLEIKRLGDWGQVIQTTLVNDTVLVTKDRLCYYYAYLLSNSDLGIKPKVILSTTPETGPPRGVTHSYGVGVEQAVGPPCKEYPPYTAGAKKTTNKHAKLPEVDPPVTPPSNEQPAVINSSDDEDDNESLFIQGYRNIILMNCWMRDSKKKNRYVKVFEAKPTPVGTRRSMNVIPRTYIANAPLTFTYMAFVINDGGPILELKDDEYGHRLKLTTASPGGLFQTIDPTAATELLPILQGFTSSKVNFRQVQNPSDTILFSKQWDSFFNQIQQTSQGHRKPISKLVLSPDFVRQGVTLPDFECVVESDEEVHTMDTGFGVDVPEQYRDGTPHPRRPMSKELKQRIAHDEIRKRNDARRARERRIVKVMVENIRRGVYIEVPITRYRLDTIEQRLSGAIAEPPTMRPKMKDILTHYYPYIFNDTNIKMTINPKPNDRYVLQYSWPAPQTKFGKTVANKANEKKKALAKSSRFGVTFRNGKFKQKSKTISWEKAWALYKKK